MFSIRPIQPADNAEIESIIRTVLAEYGADRPGFAWQDPQLADLYNAYKAEYYAYWVVEKQGVIVGGAGVAPLQPSVDGTAELQKMYLSRSARGYGIGRALIAEALQFARRHYRWLYLETYHTMIEAEALYLKTGFMPLPKPLIETEHNQCDRWYLQHIL